jgi:hypothetical protein
MEYNEEIFCTQYPLVKQFLRHSIYRTELYNLYDQNNVKSEFWTSTIDAHYLQAVIYWCMVFGADGCNPTHWKKLSDVACEELLESFRIGLYKNTTLDKKAFNEFWKGINDFRGGYAAHRELNFKGKTPMLKTAQEIAFFYDDWIRQLIYPASISAKPLREMAKTLKSQVRKIADHYMTEWNQFNFETEPQRSRGRRGPCRP